MFGGFRENPLFLCRFVCRFFHNLYKNLIKSMLTRCCIMGVWSEFKLLSIKTVAYDYLPSMLGHMDGTLDNYGPLAKRLPAVCAH